MTIFGGKIPGMAFNDNPQVDSSAERSELSVLHTSQVFTLKAGFIRREEKPDYGVDLNLEMVSNGGATGNLFAVQIKSAERVRTVTHDGKEYISIDFKTSRLGYLCRRTPGYGIIVVYDDTTSRAYFDYVEEVYQRLLDQRDNENWKDQEQVAIRIPLQELTADAARQIHVRMSTRFENTNLMIQSFGGAYSIPSIHPDKSNKVDWNNPAQVADFLARKGLDLFRDKAYRLVIDLLGRLTVGTISDAPQLALLAAVAYGQAGITMESSLYLQKAERFRDKYTTDQIFLLDYTRAIVELRNGKLTTEQFNDRLNEFKQKPQGVVDMLTIEINQLFLKFLHRGENTLEAIEQIFDKIDRAELSADNKALLKLFNLENLHTYGTELLLRDGSRYQIQVHLGVHVPMNERLQRAHQISSILKRATDGILEILKQYAGNSTTLVYGYAAYFQAKFFYLKYFNTLMVAPETRPSDAAKQDFQDAFDLCCHSVTALWQQNMMSEVHQALCCAYELQNLYRALYGGELAGKSATQILETLRDIERDTGLTPYESAVHQFTQGYLERVQNPKASWANAADDEIQRGAQRMLDAYGIPENRLPNIIAEIKGIRRFKQACANPDLELLVDQRHLLLKETLYSLPPTFSIRSKRSNIRSRPSQDIEYLLSEFSSLLKT